jgi:Periplasmic binding protein domain
LVGWSGRIGRCWGIGGRVAYTGLLDRVAPIRVGLLHSETGDMAISEKSLIDSEVLALEEINARGGLY